MRVVVADDHQMFRAGVIELLASAPNVIVVAQCANGDEVVELAGEHRPDIVVLDVEMPGPGAVATIRLITEASPHTKTVVLTMHDAPDIVREVFAAGARAYLLKSVGRPELLAAISTASQSDDAVLMIVSLTTLKSLNGSTGAAPKSLLSPRELEVLLLLTEGKNNRDIAAELFISDGTVKRHLANIYAKLDANSRLDAVRRAERLGIIGGGVREGAPRQGPSAPDPGR